jgi:CRISPR-associated exonuclease Cas4
MYSESDLLPLSALNQLVYCERRCALIHIEQAWEENRFTAEGRLLHERVHEQDSETRDNVRIARGLRLRSLRLGLAGMADVVEFYLVKQTGVSAELKIWMPFPVEYKRGKPKPDESDKTQLCAQAMCLEEMMNTTVLSGALFYGKTRKRLDVLFDSQLREMVESLAKRLHALIGSGMTPPATYEKKCESCSLLEICQPKTAAARMSVSRYVENALKENAL